MILVGQNNKAIKKARLLTNDFSGFMAYISLNDLSGLNEVADFGNGETCVKDLIEEKTKYINIGIGFNGDIFKEIINGKYDDQIAKLNSFVKDFPDITFYLRPAYECEVYWYKDFCPAFMYFYDLINAKNALICLDFMDNSKKELCMQYAKNIKNKFDVVSVNIFGNVKSEIIGAAELAFIFKKPLIIGETCPLGFEINSNIDKFIDYLNDLFIFCRKYKPVHICFIADNWMDKKIFKNVSLFENTNSSLNKRSIKKLFSYLKNY